MGQNRIKTILPAAQRDEHKSLTSPSLSSFTYVSSFPKPISDWEGDTGDCEIQSPSRPV